MPLPIYTEANLPIATIKSIIGIAAGKGGVGKSTITVNLGLALREKGYSVGILDADIYGPSLRRMLPEDRLPSQKGKEIFPALCKGIKVISFAYFRKEEEAAAIRAPIANGIIMQFIHQIVWGDLDFLLIDFPPGTGDIQLTLAQQVKLSGAVLTTTPQEVALMDVKKAAHLFHQVKVPMIGVVENMSYYQLPETDQKMALFGKGGGQKLARDLGIPFLGEIPIDPQISLSCDTGRSIFTEGSTATINAFFHFAEAVINQMKVVENQKMQSFEILWKEMDHPPQASKKTVITKKNQPNFILHLYQIDNYTFSTEWDDGSISHFRLSHLQRSCPCANCVDEYSGKRVNHPEKIKEDLTAVYIKSIGRYAIRIQFTEGCSNGIYDFDMLQKLDTTK